MNNFEENGGIPESNPPNRCKVKNSKSKNQNSKLKRERSETKEEKLKTREEKGERLEVL